ncbi:MAG: hypothetical protein ACKVOK_04755 [Flavobacteriales bacterium]
MKKNLPPDIAVMVVCFIITWADRNSSFNLPSMIQSFLADLLCVPLILFVALISIRYLKNEPTFLLSTTHIVFAFVWTSLLCEWIIPILSNRYTADWWDVAMYATGSLYVLWRQKNWFITAPQNNSSFA